MPVYVPLRDELTAPIFKPVLPAGPAVNDDLAGVCEARGAAIDTANQQFAKIRNLQPKTKTEAAK